MDLLAPVLLLGEYLGFAVGVTSLAEDSATPKTPLSSATKRGFLSSVMLLALLFGTAYVWGAWNDAQQIGRDVRRGSWSEATSSSGPLGLVVTRVLIAPRDGSDPMNLCGVPATAQLVGRGHGFAYVVVRTSGLPKGEEAPVVPLSEGDYITYPIGSDRAKAATQLCETPIKRS